jgi:phosphatidate cytidylyltransferase
MSYALLPAYYVLIATHATTAALVGFPLAMAGILVFAVINNPRVRKGRLFLSGSIAILGIGAVPLLLATSWPVTNEGLHLVLFVSLIVQITDCCQYMTGVTFGRTPLAPHISPNKTVEGVAGGLAGGLLLGLALSFLTPWSMWVNALLGMIIAGAGATGDLMLSAIKRRSGIKDFSNLIPGHGGVLDRVDSLTLAAPAFYLCARVLSGGLAISGS